MFDFYIIMLASSRLHATKYSYLYFYNRYSNPNNVLHKSKFEPVAAYNYRQESRNIEELESIKDDTDELHMESLTIR